MPKIHMLIMPLKADNNIKMLFFEFTNDPTMFIYNLSDMGVMKHYDYSQAQFFSISLWKFLYEMMPFVKSFKEYDISIKTVGNK